jgi:hypothetical protein
MDWVQPVMEAPQNSELNFDGDFPTPPSQFLMR